MIDVRKDLIQKELDESPSGLKFKQFKLKKSFIERLLNHYYCHEYTDHFYDSEPNIPDDLYDKYYEYKYGKKSYNSNKNNLVFNKEDLIDGYYKVIKMYKEYHDKRMTFNNWIEPYFSGNWGMSQQRVDEIALYALNNGIRKGNISNKDRLYIAEKDDVIWIYYYGRDFKEYDQWFIFKKRNKRSRKMKYKCY